MNLWLNINLPNLHDLHKFRRNRVQLPAMPHRMPVRVGHPTQTDDAGPFAFDPGQPLALRSLHSDVPNRRPPPQPTAGRPARSAVLRCRMAQKPDGDGEISSWGYVSPFQLEIAADHFSPQEVQTLASTSTGTSGKRAAMASTIAPVTTSLHSCANTSGHSTISSS